MNVFNDLNNLPAFQNAVLTIGSFDGVHSGHQQIIRQVNALAREVDGESVIITFHPHPRSVVYPKDTSLRLITTIEEKVQLLERFGADNVVVVPFTIAFSQQSADEYIEKFLVEKFNPHSIVIGYDHRFGLNRQGDVNYLRWHSKRGGFNVVEIEKQQIDDIAVSSSKIRSSLEAGEVKNAAKLLGHYFTLTGTVSHGQKIGKQLGFPTANLEVTQKNKLIPPEGVYAVWVLHQQQRYGGMLYIGKRPTLKDYNHTNIEVNIFDFNRDIYGDKLQMELVDYIRGDQSFDDLDALSEQLKKDRMAVKKVLAQTTPREMEKKTPVQPKVAVVILNYNGKKHLQQFLPSVLACAYPNFEIVVADNASTDDSVAFLKKHFPDVRLIRLPANYGFALGYNMALEEIQSDYYVLLNSDVEVTPGWIDPIIELMERDPTVAACQPKIKSYVEKNKFEYAGASGGWIDYFGYPFCRGRIFAVTETDHGQYNDTQEIFWASGAALFIRANLFHNIGGFDGDYFAHAEEIDLCWRLKNAGYKVMVRPRSVVYHVGGGTLTYNTPFKAFLNFRNNLFNLLKNEPAHRLPQLIIARLLLDGLAAVLFLTQGKIKHIGSILKAHGHFYRDFFKNLRKRKEYRELIQKVSISAEPNTKGRYQGSIVWQYFGLRKRSFRQLK